MSSRQPVWRTAPARILSAARTRIVGWMLLLMMAALAVATFATWRLLWRPSMIAGRILRPPRDVSDTARSITETDLSRRPR